MLLLAEAAADLMSGRIISNANGYCMAAVCRLRDPNECEGPPENFTLTMMKVSDWRDTDEEEHHQIWNFESDEGFFYLQGYDYMLTTNVDNNKIM